MSEQSNEKLSDPHIRELLKGRILPFVFVNERWLSHVTPTWVDIENGNILINTALGRIKQTNISRDPRVALSIIDQNNQYEMVTIRGKVIDQITGDAG